MMQFQKLIAATAAVGISTVNAQCNPTKGMFIYKSM